MSSAHADLRPSNVLWREAEAGAIDIKIVDFDWSGVITKDPATTLRYPRFVSQGVHPCWVQSGLAVQPTSDDGALEAWC